MQKNYTISCCAECPAFLKKNNFCKKNEMSIGQDSSDTVNMILLGFPEWCSLPDVEIAGNDLNVELKKVARQILKRLDLDTDDSSVTSVFHYLNTVVDIKGFKDAKEKMEGNGLPGLPSS
jgi:hypothetical protein